MNERIRDVAIYVLLAALTAVAYLPALSCNFVDFDDPLYVMENSHVRQGLTSAGIWYAWTTFDTGNWIPGTWMSYLLDASMFGVNPAGFHAVNVFWHAANSCLVYYALHKFTGARMRSALVAALFAVHPLHVESVAWISERKDLLSMFWLLVTLIAYERFAARSDDLRRYVSVCLAMAAGLLCKSMLVTVPVLLLLIDFWPLSRWDRFSSGNGKYPLRTTTQLIVEKLPLFGLALGDGLVTIAAQHSVAAMSSLEQISTGSRLLNAVRALGWYFCKTFCPTGLCVYYPYPITAVPVWQVAGSLLLLGSVSIYVLLGWQENRHRFTGWFWFVISLLPVLGVLQVGGQAQADRYTYIPHLGLFVFLVWEAHRVLALLGARRLFNYSLVGFLIVGCLLLTRAQAATWKDSETLWRHTLALNPANNRAHVNLAFALTKQGRFDEAVPHFETVLGQKAFVVIAAINLADIHVRRQQWQSAAEYFEWALRIEPENRRARDGLAYVHENRGDGNREAKSAAACSVDATAHLKAGLAEARQGRMPTALREFQRALEIDPACALAHNNAGLAQFELGKFPEAEAHYRQAIARDVANANYRVNLAALLEALERTDEARAEYEAASRLKPEDVEIRFRLQQMSGNPSR